MLIYRSGIDNISINSNYDLCNAILMILNTDILNHNQINTLLLDIFKLSLSNSISEDNTFMECQNTLERCAKIGKVINIHENSDCSDLEIIFNSCIQYYMNIMGGNANLGSCISLFIDKTTSNPDIILTEHELIIWLKSNIFKYIISKRYINSKWIAKSKLFAPIYSYYIKLNSDNITSVNVSYPMVISPRRFKEVGLNEYYGGTLWNSKYKLNPLVLTSGVKNISISKILIRVLENIQNIPLKADIKAFENIIISLNKDIIYTENNIKNNKVKSAALSTYKYKIQHINEIIYYLKEFNVNRLYFPLSICFRGRIYANSLISYTSTPLARGIKFFDSNKDIAEFDATCNMLQILAILMGSIRMMINSNVIPDHMRSDPYAFFIPKASYSNKELQDKLDAINTYLADHKATRIVTIESFQYTLTYIDRNLIKKTIMTWLYGSNIHSIYNRMKFTEGYNNIKYNTILLIISKFYIKYKDECNTITFINRINRAILDNNYSWTINSGSIRFDNLYNKFISKSVTLPNSENTDNKMKIIYKTSTTSKDKHKSSVSFIPNFAHSIDAYVVFITNAISMIHPTLNLKTIHDAFLTTKDHEDLIKMIYASTLYSQRYALSNSIKENIHKLKWYKEITENIPKPKGVHSKSYNKQIKFINDINLLINKIEAKALITESYKDIIINSKFILKEELKEELNHD